MLQAVFHVIDFVFVASLVLAALATAGHALIYKREPRAATLWIVVICGLPGVGALLYVLIGINRVERRAVRMRSSLARFRSTPQFPASNPGTHLVPLARLVGTMVERPLLPGNSVEALVDGTRAFPAMLEAISGARQSIAAGVNVAVFNPPMVPARLHAANLRNHRKILVVDGATAFTGGMNVDCRYLDPATPQRAYRDLQFRLRGPVVTHIAEVFCDDWNFATGELLRAACWFPPLAAAGEIQARAIEAGPDENFERLRWAMIGGVNAAQRSVRVLTPYFLPDQVLIAALNAAAMRGVEVDIVIPSVSDLPHVQWAVFGQLWQVLGHGCRVWLQRAPFDHSKLLVVDGAWTLLGSANWDARSLRLNFELDVECYSVEFGAHMDALIQARIAAARPLTLAQIDARPLPVKLRDGIARLFAPYL